MFETKKRRKKVGGADNDHQFDAATENVEIDSTLKTIERALAADKAREDALRLKVLREAERAKDRCGCF